MSRVVGELKKILAEKTLDHPSVKHRATYGEDITIHTHIHIYGQLETFI